MTLYLAGGRIADVRAGVLRRADVAISGDRITAVLERGGGARSGPVLDVAGRVIVPGYIEPHTHFTLASPSEFAGAILRRGTTTAAVDALPLISLGIPDRLPALLEQLASLPMKIRWLIRLHPPAFVETDRFTLPYLRTLWRLPSAAAVGEVTRWVDVLHGDPDLLDKMRAAAEDGRRIEGHAAGASFERLAQLREAGFTSCHEAITAGEVADRLRAGLATMLRHSSIRPDLPALLPAVADRPEWLDQVMLTTDGSTPSFVEEHGDLDHLMRVALDQGIAAMDVLRMVTRNPARYFGFDDVGEVAVGKRADLNVLRSMDDPTPSHVIADGRVVAEEGRLLDPVPSVRLAPALDPPALPRLAPGVLVTGARTPGLRLLNDVITELVPADEAGRDALHVAVVDRQGRWITRSMLSGFTTRLGGLATSFTTGFDVAVLGEDPSDMAAALAVLAEDGGGMAIVERGVVLHRFAFDDVAYSSRPWSEVVQANRRFAALLRDRGYRFADPIYSLLFLTFDSLPWIRLTSRGIWDVRNRNVIVPAQPL